MRISERNLRLANKLRDDVRKKTEVISDGEGVAMALLWGFLMEHAQCEGVNLEQLAREQLEAWIVYARHNIVYQERH